MGREQSPLEERLNAGTHLVGLLFFVGVLGLALNHGALPWYMWVYFGAQLFLYTASSGYHLTTAVGSKRKWRTADHISIYFSIAGTYTPICMTALMETQGMLLLYAVWAVALFGTVWKLFFTGRYEAFSGVLYILMGFLVMIDQEGLANGLHDDQLYYLIAGGLFFVVGFVFYAWQKIPYNHVIWHLFVLAGSWSHYQMLMV